jgi:tetratricopeptide (TPR) repeat protein
MEIKVETVNPKIDLMSAAQLFAEGKTISETLGVTQGYKDSLYSIAVVDYEAKRYEKAIKGLQFLVVLDQNNADYWALLGNALKDSGMYLEAITAWHMAMRAEPKLKTALVIARVGIAIKNKDAAREGLMMSLAHLGDNPKDAADYQKLLEAYEAL